LLFLDLRRGERERERDEEEAESESEESESEEESGSEEEEDEEEEEADLRRVRAGWVRRSVLGSRRRGQREDTFLASPSQQLVPSPLLPRS
jgi:hypothetical protein